MEAVIMKINTPITDKRIFFPESAVLISTTNTKGTILFVNQQFAAVSGFAEAELVGKSHNVVRHPDMPKTIFQDMWSHLKKGTIWCGILKNRTKTGNFYWVNVHITPIYKDGALVKFMSVRYTPTEDAVKNAQMAYKC